LGSKLMA